MLTSSSPLLERQDPTDMLNQRPFASPQKTALRTRSRTNWTWFSVSSFVFNATILLSLLYGVGTCTATIRSTLMPGNEYCLHTVSTSYNYITFTGEGYGTYYGPKCLNPLRTISTYASGKTFCKDKEILIGFEKIRRECEDGGLEFLDWQQVVSIVTDDDIAQMRVVEFNEVPEGTNITDPVRLSNSFFERVGNTLVRISRVLLLSKRLTLADDLGIRDELASPVRFCTLCILEHCSWSLNNRTCRQIYQLIVPIAQYAVKHNDTNFAIGMDMGPSKPGHSASFWITSPTSTVLVYNPNTHREHRCTSFLSLDDVSFPIPLSSDKSQHLVRTRFSVKMADY